MIAKPWLHFVLLGCLYYLVQSFLFPESKPVVGPLSQERTEAIINKWTTISGTPPNQQKITDLISIELDRDMLFQEALDLNLHLRDDVVKQRLLMNMNFLRMTDVSNEQEQFQKALDLRLHLNDEVVKRRLISLVEQILLRANPTQTPSDQTIEEYFKKNSTNYLHPETYSFEQLFFPEEKIDEATNLMTKIAQENLTIDDIRDISYPFIQGQDFNQYSSNQLIQIFGQNFVKELQAFSIKSKEWIGPLKSPYGLHYLWIRDYSPAHQKEFSEVRAEIINVLEYEINAATLKQATAKLREKYKVILDANE